MESWTCNLKDLMIRGTSFGFSYEDMDRTCNLVVSSLMIDISSVASSIGGFADVLWIRLDCSEVVDDSTLPGVDIVGFAMFLYETEGFAGVGGDGWTQEAHGARRNEGQRNS